MNQNLFKRLFPNLLLLALAGFAYFKAGQFFTGSEGGFVGPDLWPRIICVVLALTSAIGIIAALVSVVAQASEKDEVLESMLAVPETHPRLVWIGVAATGLYVAALTSIGYLCATMLYAMALLVIGGMRRWAMVPIYGAILAIVFTIIFMKIVYVALPLGEGMFKSVSLFAMQLLGIH